MSSSPAEAVDLAAVDLAAVDAAIATRRWSLAFPASLEALFEAATGAARLRYFEITGLVAVVLYDAFLVNDWLLLHDRFPAMIVARLAVFTPALLALLAVNHLRPSPRRREWSAAAGAILGVLLPAAVMVTSASPHKLVYQSGALLVMMFATVIQRVRFGPAATCLSLMLVAQLTAVDLVFDLQTSAAIAIFYATAAILLLMAVYFAERADRRAFLLAMRGRLLHDVVVDQANRDALTQLFNRRHLDEVALSLWAAPEPAHVAAILLDIDHFKLFNDSYGHLAGDECLRSVSACVLAHAIGGLAVRFGGEEILVLLPGRELGEAIAMAETIRRALAEVAIPHPALGGPAVVSASFGAGHVTTADASMAELVAAADQALYAAKRAGRNCVRPIDWRRAEPLLIADARRPAGRRSA